MADPKMERLIKARYLREYRRTRYPIYHYADMAFVVVWALYIIIGAIFIAMDNWNGAYFLLVAGIVFFIEAVRGRYEFKWIESWARKDGLEF